MELLMSTKQRLLQTDLLSTVAKVVHTKGHPSLYVYLCQKLSFFAVPWQRNNYNKKKIYLSALECTTIINSVPLVGAAHICSDGQEWRKTHAMDVGADGGGQSRGARDD